MTAISDRLQRGLDAAKDGDIDTARTILGEVASIDDGWSPVSGLPPQTEAKYYQLMGELLEHDEDGDMAEEAWDRVNELEEEALALDPYYGQDDADDAPPPASVEAEVIEAEIVDEDEFEEALEVSAAELVPCGCLSRDEVDPENHAWDKRLVLYDDGDTAYRSEQNSDTVRSVYSEEDRTYEVLETVSTFESSFEAGSDEAPEALLAVTGEEDPGHRGFVEKHVQAYTVVRTTYVYDNTDDDPPALPE